MRPFDWLEWDCTRRCHRASRRVCAVLRCDVLWCVLVLLKTLCEYYWLTMRPGPSCVWDRYVSVSECLKCAKILQEFTIPDASSGPDKLIPKAILAKCHGVGAHVDCLRGFDAVCLIALCCFGCMYICSRHSFSECTSTAIISVFKAGFLVTIRGGTGLVIARLSNGRTIGLIHYSKQCSSSHVRMLA